MQTNRVQTGNDDLAFLWMWCPVTRAANLVIIGAGVWVAVMLIPLSLTTYTRITSIGALEWQCQSRLSSSCRYRAVTEYGDYAVSFERFQGLTVDQSVCVTYRAIPSFKRLEPNLCAAGTADPGPLR